MGTDPNPNHARHAGQPMEPTSRATASTKTSTQARFWGQTPIGGSGLAWSAYRRRSLLPPFMGTDPQSKPGDRPPIQTMQGMLDSPWNRLRGLRRARRRVRRPSFGDRPWDRPQLREFLNRPQSKRPRHAGQSAGIILEDHGEHEHRGIIRFATDSS